MNPGRGPGSDHLHRYALSANELGADETALCVLASGSSGNCSALVTPGRDGARRTVTLIDLGLSPRRTRKDLAQRGIDLDEVSSIVLTHLDSDHCHAGWPAALAKGATGATLRIHRRHLGRAERAGLLNFRTDPFDQSLSLSGSLGARVELLAHDSLGVACFRFISGDTHIGYATDCGRVTPGLIALMRGVDCLAIESNYCPDLQERSPRPRFLKDRIMGGSGHLSNQLSADAVRRIGPREHLVLLHLSRQCNSPELAAIEHEHPGVIRTITDQFVPSPWVRISGSPRPNAESFLEPVVEQRSLFGPDPERTR